MGLINLYNTISNEHSVIKGTGKLKDLISNADSYLLINAGNRVSSDFVIDENDVIYARLLPKGVKTGGDYGFKTPTVTAPTIDVGGIKKGLAETGTTTVDEIIDTVEEVLNHGVGECSTSTHFISWDFGRAKREKEQAELEAEQQRRATELAQQIETLPFIQGATNKSALGSSIPYVIGEMYNTPSILNGGYYSIEGENGVNQFYNATLLCGYKQGIAKVCAGDDTLVEPDGSLGQNVTLNATNSKYSGSKVEIKNSGELTLCGSQKVVATHHNHSFNLDDSAETTSYEFTLADNTMKVELCIKFDGLRKWDEDSGTWVNINVSVIPQWTNVDDPSDSDWNTFNFSGQTKYSETENTFYYQTKSTIRFVATKEFAASECFGKKLKIRIKHTNTYNVTGETFNATPVLLYSNCFCYDAKTSSSSVLKPCYPLINPYRDNTTRIGIKILANDKIETSLNQFNVISVGYARTYNKNTNTWSTSKNRTRNPASWILEVLTSDTHSLSKYNDDEIDLNSLGSLYTYCEENNLYCDNLLTSGTKKESIISDILKTVNTSMFFNNEGLLEFAIDKEEINPVALINCQNVKSISYAKTLARQVTGAKVTYTNRENWNVENEYFMRTEGATYQQGVDTITELTLNYVTTHNHAYKYTQRLLRKAILQPRTITVDVGTEGDYYPLYSTILLQLEQLKQGIKSSVISNVLTNSDGYISKIKIADYVDFVDGNNYGVIIQAQSDAGKQLFYKAVTGSGRTKTLTFSEPINPTLYDVIPNASNILSFGLLNDDGSFTKITNKMKIVGTTPSSNNGWTLVLNDYNAEIYEYGTIPDYKSNITNPPKTIKEEEPLKPVEMTEIAQQFTSPVYSKVSNLFNTQTIYIYKESETVLTDADLPTSRLIFNFSTKNPSWQTSDEGYPTKSNGWSWDYPETPTNTVYTAIGTAQSQSTTANIEAEDWSTPLPTGRDGTNGMNAYTVTLYMRTNDAPTSLPSNLVYNFISGGLTGSKNGWQTSIPAVDEEGNHCWEIHATALSESSTATITPEKWSNPIQITSDGITKADVVEIVQEEIENVAETPNVYADFNSANFYVNSRGVTPNSQEAAITVHVLQTNEELDFRFDTEALDVAIPSGMSYSIDYHTITFKVSEGVKVTCGSFVIPIIYRSYKNNSNLGWTDEESNTTLLADDEGTILGFATYYDNETTYDLGFTYSAIKGGINKGVVTSIENIPADVVIGDYFTWVGADTASSLSQDGQFKQCAIYYYLGDSSSYRWNLDSDPEHLASALSDVLSVANADLETNNSDAYMYLSHLSANTIFAQMIVANKAFINSLSSDEAFIGKIVANEAFIEQIQASGILAQYARLDELDADHIDATNLEVDNGKFTKCVATELEISGKLIGDLNSNNSSIVLNNLLIQYSSDQTSWTDHILDINSYYVRVYINNNWIIVGQKESKYSSYLYYGFSNSINGSDVEDTFDGEIDFTKNTENKRYICFLQSKRYVGTLITYIFPVITKKIKGFNLEENGGANFGEEVYIGDDLIVENQLQVNGFFSAIAGQFSNALISGSFSSLNGIFLDGNYSISCSNSDFTSPINFIKTLINNYSMSKNSTTHLLCEGNISKASAIIRFNNLYYSQTSASITIDGYISISNGTVYMCTVFLTKSYCNVTYNNTSLSLTDMTFSIYY